MHNCTYYAILYRKIYIYNFNNLVEWWCDLYTKLDRPIILKLFTCFLWFATLFSTKYGLYESKVHAPHHACSRYEVTCSIHRSAIFLPLSLSWWFVTRYLCVYLLCLLACFHTVRKSVFSCLHCALLPPCGLNAEIYSDHHNILFITRL